MLHDERHHQCFKDCGRWYTPTQHVKLGHRAKRSKRGRCIKWNLARKCFFCSGADRLRNQWQVEFPTWAWWADRTNTWSAWYGTPHSLGDTIGTRKNTRASVLHVGFVEPRCEGVDNHVQVKLWAVHDSHRRRVWKQRECSKNGRRPERTTTS